MDKTEIQTMIDESVTKAFSPVLKAIEDIKKAASAATPIADPPPVPASEPAPAPGPADESVTKEEVAQMVGDEVAKAIAPLLKSAGLPSNLNDEKPVEKAGQHFLAGIL